MAEPRESVPSGEPVRPDGAEPAPLGRRFLALFIDWLLCLLLSTLIGDPRSEAWPAVFVLIVEYAFFLGVFAQTPGMAVARLRCVSYADGGPIGVPRAALRAVLLCLVVPAAVMDDQRRGWHDRAAGSIVVTASGR